MRWFGGGDNKEGRALEQNDFCCTTCISKGGKMFGEDRGVGDEGMDNARPGLHVQSVSAVSWKD